MNNQNKVRILIEKSDGHKQHYWVNRSNLPKYVLRTGQTFKPRRLQPKKVPLTMGRVTTAINYVNRKEYYSYVRQVWYLTEPQARVMVDFVKIELIKGLEKHLGYPQSEWWFTDTPSSAVEEVSFDPSLIGQVREDSEYVGGSA